MRVTIDMDNLQAIIEEAAKTNTQVAVEEAIKEVASVEVNKVLRGKIEEIVSSAISGYVNDYLRTTKICVGGGWNSKEVEEYTAEEYLRKQIKDVFESQSFVTKNKDRWGNVVEEKRTFQEYVQQQLNAEELVKPYIDKMARSVKEEVNRRVKEMFDDAMRTTLAENVFAIVSASDTYRTVSNSLKLLGT